MRRSGLLALALGALLALASPAAAEIPDLGQPPWKCGMGCYGYDSGPGAMDGTGGAEVTIGKHIAHLDDTVTVNLGLFHSDWTFTWPSGAAGLTRIGTCPMSARTCDYKATSATNAWAEFNMKFYSCCTASESDYYAVIGDGWAVEGTVMDRDPRDATRLTPASNVDVVVSGTGGVYRKPTNKLGDYAILVPAGTYTVQTARKHCLKTDLPKCTTSKSVTLSPDQEIDFEAPPPVKVTGTVKDEDGNNVKGVLIRANAVDGGARVGSAKSGADGRYEMKVPTGNTRFSADDPKVCVVSSGGTCPKSRDVDLTRDTSIDFKLVGCVAKVDFKNSMVAVNGCFKKVEDEVWTTEDPFRLNGIDVAPGGKVTLDKVLQKVVFGPVHLRAGTVDLGEFPGITLDYSSPKQSYKPLKGINVFGLIAGSSISLDSESGKSTFAFTMDIPLSLAPNTPEASCRGRAEPKVTLITTNDFGLTEIGFEVDPSKVFCLPSTDKEGGVTVAALRGAFDLSTGWWRIGGKVKGIPLFGNPKTEIDAELTFDNQQFIPRKLTANADGIDKPLNGSFYLQRIGLNGGMTGPTAPVVIGINAGFSLGPRNKDAKTITLPFLGTITQVPKEKAALDVDVTVSDVDANPLTTADMTLKGTGSVKVFDYKVASGSLTFLPATFTWILNGSMQFADPTGQYFSFRGATEAWVDVSRSIVYGTSQAQASIRGLDPFASEVLFKSTPSTNVIAACSTDLFQEPGASGLPPKIGVVINFEDLIPKVGGCDMARYRETTPTAATTAAAKSKSFRLPDGLSALAVEVVGTGPGAPVVAITGPGAKLTSKPADALRKKSITAIPVPASKTTYLLLDGPRGGRWTVRSKGGGTIAKLRYSTELPPARVAGTLAGDACKPALSWSYASQPGQTVMLVDEGVDGSRVVLFEEAKATGKVAIAPPAPGVRTIKAIVLQDGSLRTTIALGTYGLPATGPAAPAKLTVRRKGARGGVVSWRAACGAVKYAVKVGTGKAEQVSGTSFTIKKLPKKGSVRVTSLTAAGKAGGSALRPIAPGAKS